MTALLHKSSQSHGESLAIWDHTVLPATQHKSWPLALTKLQPDRLVPIYLPRRDGRL